MTLPCRSSSISLFFLLLVAVFGLPAADASNTRISPCALTDKQIAGLNVDAGTEIRAVPDYQKTVALLLRAAEFEKLDCIADSARDHKEMFPGGTWKLHAIYLGLEKPRVHATQKDWKAHIALLKQWIAARPQSITARVALAEAYVDYAWDARGHGYSDTVSETGWKLFNERAAQGRKTLTQASTLRQKCPEWYAAMQDVALAQGWKPSAKQALLDQAVKFEPDYFYYYRRYAVSILPQWDGEDGQLEKFLQSTADHIGGEAGDILYFQVAGLLVCCQIDQKLKFSWPRIQRGFADLEKHRGAAPENWNRLARIAAIHQDPVVANQMLARIGDQWSQEIWQTFSYFEAVRDWAKQVTPMMDAKSPEEENADANLQTADGQRYKAAFDETMHTVLLDCTNASSGTFSNSKLLFRIGKDGTVDQVITVVPAPLHLA